MQDFDDYDEVAEYGPITKLQKTVKTPGVDEENTKTVYQVNDELVRVSRIGTLGWKARVVGNGWISPSTYYDKEEEAQDVAKELIRELL